MQWLAIVVTSVPVVWTVVHRAPPDSEGLQLVPPTVSVLERE